MKTELAAKYETTDSIFSWLYLKGIYIMMQWTRIRDANASSQLSTNELHL